MPESETVQDVRRFWNTEACGTHFVPEFTNDRDFYEKLREHRYRTEWHIPLVAPFAASKGKRVLEIGTGNGADAVIFALNGAHYTGIDLTRTAIEATKNHFAVLGLSGTFQRENAEQLSFADNSFDIVYSYGVLHHTPNPQRAIDEVWRVLKTGGTAVVMVYHKHSFNYFVRIMIYMRLRVLGKILSRLGKWRRHRRAADLNEIIGLRGNQDPQLWELHYRNFLREGWSYLRAENFIHHCTDGPECPIAYAFSKWETARLFAMFRELRFRVAYFPLRKYWKRFPFIVEKFLAERIGWYLIVSATK